MKELTLKRIEKGDLFRETVVTDIVWDRMDSIIDLITDLHKGKGGLL